MRETSTSSLGVATPGLTDPGPAHLKALAAGRTTVDILGLRAKLPQ